MKAKLDINGTKFYLTRIICDDFCINTKNAVSIETGELLKFDYTSIVSPVDATVIIKDCAIFINEYNSDWSNGDED